MIPATPGGRPVIVPVNGTPLTSPVTGVGDGGGITVARSCWRAVGLPPPAIATLGVWILPSVTELVASMVTVPETDVSAMTTGLAGFESRNCTRQSWPTTTPATRSPH